MDLGIKGKRALVTGGSSGLGAASALALAAEGAQVVIAARDQARLQQAAEHVANATGSRPATVSADVSSAEDIARLAADVGAVDILVSNSGGPPPGQFLDTTPEQWRQAHALLLESAAALTRAVLPGMIEKGWGRIIYVTSVAVLQPINDLMLSNAYRAAVTGMCKTLSNNYARHGVTFNCVCPGYTATERLLNLAANRAKAQGGTPDDVMRGFGSLTPVGRVGQPEEFGAVVAFLASQRASFVTGSSIPIDGGLHGSIL